MKKYLSSVMALLVTFILLSSWPPVSAKTVSGSCLGGENKTAADNDINMAFADYWNHYAQYSIVETKKILPAADAVLTNSLPVKTEESLLLTKGGSATWQLTVEKSGLYRVGLYYRAADDFAATLKVGVQINGEVPFAESSAVSLNRVYEDAETIIKDNAGNDMVPLQQAAKVFNTQYFDAVDNYVADSFYFYFPAGTNQVTLIGVQSSVEIRSLLIGEEAVPDYASYLSSLKTNIPTENQLVFHEAEQTLYKSDSALVPENDNSNPAISPSDPQKILLNVIGGDNWSERGQWICWSISVPKDGMYQISFKYKQSTLRGLDVSRRLTIDGEILFSQMKQLIFPYSKGWNYVTLGNKETPVYLTKGNHQLRLEIGSSPINVALSNIESALSDMNTLYRQIIMITGTSPDLYNDYFLHRQIPNLTSTLSSIAEILQRAAEEIESQTGTKGSEASAVYEIVSQLKSLSEKPNTIPARLDRYKSNISTLADLLLRFRESPLQLDGIVLTSGSQALPETSTGFFEFLWFRFQTFLYSFSTDYSQIGSQNDGSGQTLKVWACTSAVDSGADIGRDQMRILKRMIDNKFTQKTGVPVKLSLISSADVLQQAVVGNQQPDVAMFLPKGTPVNLAYREAIVNLLELSYFSEWKQRVRANSLIPYTCEGGVYAMPDTQIFSMLFYRTDIFEQLDLEPPQTWDEVYEVTAQLQQNNLEAGISSDENTFYMLLQQAGLPIYNQNNSKVLFDNSNAVSVFRQWTELYTLYGIPVSFDFFNRFRTGEMSMGIMSMSLYNKLSAAAPEIDGLWSIVPIPGTMRDGVIHREQITSSTGSVIMRKSVLQKEAAAFLDWWSCADTQKEYGDTVESMLGLSGRYYSANQQVQSQVVWPEAFQDAISDSYADFTDLPQTLATYYLSRNINNAFRKVVYNNGNSRETLYNYTREINDELTRKRSDFRLVEKE
ncbi:MAG: extracellular solute-binding protein [Clostridiales bacterium]|nr:extracellular solute-binding protein [Clostridiales bacterium]